MNSSITDQFPEWLKEYDLLHIIVASGLLLLFVLILIVFGIRKSRKKPAIPFLTIPSFQIAPLGKDAFLKLNNPGERLTLLALEIIGKTDIHVKNQVAGHVMATAANYSILMEASSNNRIGNDLKVAVTFVDGYNKTYRQVFTLDPIESVSIKRTRK